MGLYGHVMRCVVRGFAGEAKAIHSSGVSR